MKNYAIPLTLGVIFFVLGVLTLHGYGINWDGPFRMMRGQTLLYYFLTGKDRFENVGQHAPMLISENEFATRYDFLDGEEGKWVGTPSYQLRKTDGSFYQSNSWPLSYWNNVGGHGPFVDIVAALSNRIFFEKLSLVGDIESYQLVYILFSSLGIFVVSAFTCELTKSRLAAIIAGASLGLYPLYFSEAHFNMKDTIQASFFAGAAWAFWRWVLSRQLRWFGAFTLFVAMAMATKMNIVFLPVVLVPWIFLIRKTEEFKKWFKLKNLLCYGGIFVIINLAFIILIWPYLWTDILVRLGSIFELYRGFGIRGDPAQPLGFIGPVGINFYPLILLIGQTPEILLILFSVGLYFMMRKKNDLELKARWLLFLWILIPILRVSSPGFWFYSGLRQIMEVLPAIAIISGIGVWLFVQKFPKLKFGVILILGIGLVMPILRYHPHENLYFNNLVGGFSGAVRAGLYDTKHSFGNPYKQAALWLNQNAARNSKLALTEGNMYALSPIWLREDISLSPHHFSGMRQEGEYIMVLENPTNPTIFNYLYPKRFLKPVHEVKVDARVVLSIYRNHNGFASSKLKNIKMTDKFQIVRTQEGVVINLGEEREVVGIKLERTLPICQESISQFVDQFIEFDSGARYGLSEVRKISPGEREFSFAGEKTKRIRVKILDPRSCFNAGRVSEISYVE